MTRHNHSLQLTLGGLVQSPSEDGIKRVALHTDSGRIRCHDHPAGAGEAAVLWMFGAGDGLGGPVGGIYYRLGRQLVSDSIASLELDYRRRTCTTAYSTRSWGSVISARAEGSGSCSPGTPSAEPL